MTGTASWITKRPGRRGGEACIRDTRVTVWGLVEYRRLGLSDQDILQAVQGLTQADLQAAATYAAAHPDEIERAMWQNEACMVEHDDRHVPRALIQRGQRLGLSTEDIRQAFSPPLSTEELATALMDQAET